MPPLGVLINRHGMPLLSLTWISVNMCFGVWLSLVPACLGNARQNIWVLLCMLNTCIGHAYCVLCVTLCVLCICKLWCIVCRYWGFTDVDYVCCLCVMSRCVELYFVFWVFVLCACVLYLSGACGMLGMCLVWVLICLMSVKCVFCVWNVYWKFIVLLCWGFVLCIYVRSVFGVSVSLYIGICVMIVCVCARASMRWQQKRKGGREGTCLLTESSRGIENL